MYRILIAFLGLTWAIPAFAVVGCLTSESDLTKRASIILVGKVVEVGRKQVKACPPEPALTPGKLYVPTYPKCGEVGLLTFKVSKRLRGDAPTVVEILVAPEGIFSLTCDDRPPLEKMLGLQAVLFLKSEEGQLWTLDGPNSIYVFGHGITKQGVEHLSHALERRHGPTEQGK